MNHIAAIIRWRELLAATASTPEESKRWRELAAAAAKRDNAHRSVV